MLINPLTVHIPKTLSEAAHLYSDLDNVRIQAGGTFLLNALKLLKRKNAKTPTHVICLNKIEEIKGIKESKEGLQIGAMTTIDELFCSHLLKDNFSVLKEVCRNISTQPIRNMASVGGNLTCRYTWTEMPAVMIALEASLHFIDNKGEKHTLSAEEFFSKEAKTDKLLAHISLPRQKDALLAYRRVKKTQFVDIPLLSLLIKTFKSKEKFHNTIVAVNNCVTFAQRDDALENYLNTASLHEGTAEEALDHLEKSIYDKRSSDYKKHMFRVSLKSAIEELSEKIGPSLRKK